MMDFFMYANRIGYNSIQYTSVCNKPDIQYTSRGTYNTHSSVTVMNIHRPVHGILTISTQ